MAVESKTESIQRTTHPLADQARNNLKSALNKLSKADQYKIDRLRRTYDAKPWTDRAHDLAGDAFEQYAKDVKYHFGGCRCGWQLSNGNKLIPCCNCIEVFMRLNRRVW